MQPFEKLLQNNRVWANEKIAKDPDYFKRLVHLQTPDFLWIGCSDSRVPANEITDTEPGAIFVHRNVANLVVHTDMNLMTVLEYAINYLKVNHVIVCGHYGCGGVKAAMTPRDMGISNKWLRNIKDVYRIHNEELSAIGDETLRYNRLVELNVEEQVKHLINTDIIQKAWQREQRPHLHGWVYDLHDGILHALKHYPPNSPIDPIYKYDFDPLNS